MDDLDWTYADDPAREATDGVANRDLSEPERTQPHLRAVFDLIVAQHPSFTELRVQDEWWGWARKAPGEPRRYTRRDVAARSARWRQAPPAAPLRAGRRRARTLRGPEPKEGLAPFTSARLARSAASRARSAASASTASGGVLALVALAAAGARERLLHVLDREHAEGARHAGAGAGRPGSRAPPRRRRSRSGRSRRGSRRRGRRRPRSARSRRGTSPPAAARTRPARRRRRPPPRPPRRTRAARRRRAAAARSS